MAWSFIWRFLLYGWGLATCSTFLVGFFVKLFGGDTGTAYTVGMVVQGLALVLGAASAYLNAKDAQTT